MSASYKKQLHKRVKMSMTVYMKYFGVIAEEAGKSEESLELDSESLDIKSLKSHCVELYSLSDPNSIQVAVNQNLGKSGALQDGDEIALLPPFSGG